MAATPADGAKSVTKLGRAVHFFVAWQLATFALPPSKCLRGAEHFSL